VAKVGGMAGMATVVAGMLELFKERRQRLYNPWFPLATVVSWGLQDTQGHNMVDPGLSRL